MGRAPSAYRDTIALPHTDFPMRAGLAEREPELVARWREQGLYHAVLEKNRQGEPFVLHDSPVSAHGPLHHGTAYNRVLKDIVVKARNMAGQRAELIPGWNGHGLPIEYAASQELGATGAGTEPTVLELRAACQRRALACIETQRRQLQRLGVLADWDRAYRTIDPAYEARVVRELGRFIGRGLYRGCRPVHWCPSCRRTLAEVEVSHRPRELPSVFFAMAVRAGLEAVAALDGRQVSLALWTTTPWTLAACRAVAYGPSIVYRAFAYRDGFLVGAPELMQKLQQELGLEIDLGRSHAVPSEALRKMQVEHPLDPELLLPVLPAGFVEAAAGTGLVDVTPGQGPDDHDLGEKHGLEVVALVDPSGRLRQDTGPLAGCSVDEADAKVLEQLSQSGRLLSPADSSATRDCAHCSRCQAPLIYRAIEQWFLSLSEHNLRARATEASDGVRWLPDWGRRRLQGMLSRRPDWCLSRQRAWGIPIPAVYCEACDTAVLAPAVIDRVAELFALEGADAWFARSCEDLLPPGFACPRCGERGFRRERDLIDIWFENGVSFVAAASEDTAPTLPVDLCIEGSDQHRGWFQAALLTAVGTRSAAPYSTALTHGFVVDGAGRRLDPSKVPAVDGLLQDYGADVFRLWVFASDFRTDQRLSLPILQNLVEAYRKIRNALRFALANLADFEPGRDGVDSAELLALDRYILVRFGQLLERSRDAYLRLELHRIYQDVNEFVGADLSAFYYAVIKDRLYCDPPQGQRRRSAQTALHWMCRDLLGLLAPVLCFTCEEAHDHLPDIAGKPASVHLRSLPDPAALLALESDGLLEDFGRLRMYRAEVLHRLEPFRAHQRHAAHACAVIGGSFEVRDFLSCAPDLASLFSVSQVELVELHKAKGLVESQRMPEFGLRIEPARGRLCARCRRWDTAVGEGDKADLCPRCDAVLGDR